MNRIENAEIAVLCLVTNGNKILLQNRVNNNWEGYTLPGGHLEREESVVDAVIREVKEETGLDIIKPKLCGIKQFPIEEGRYFVFLFKTDNFSGILQSSDEGKVEWIERSKLEQYNLVEDFHELLSVFEDDNLTEFKYEKNASNWNVVLK